MDKITKFFLACPENNYRPPVLSYKAFLIYGALLLILRLLLGALPTQSAGVESDTLMSLINQERQQRNLPVLFVHQSLLKAAAQKSQDMIDRDYFAHVDPDGNYVWPKIVAAGYAPYKILGENLALDFSTSEGMVKAWIDSPTHRANLLHRDFLNQGLSALFGDFQNRYTNLTASLFGTLAGAPKSQVESQGPVAPEPPPPQAPAEPAPATPAPPSSNSPPTEEAPPAPAEESKEPALLPIIQQTGERTVDKLQDTLFLSRIIFTLFGAFLLLVLSADSVIIHRRELQAVSRSHSSYHLLGFLLIVLISILIWYW